MRVGILGTRGIPNHYGGFEQFAQYLALGLKQIGCEVYVYNSSDHPFKDDIWNGIKVIHKYDPEYLIGLSGQFIYDLNCILDSRKRKFDVLLQLGYTTSSIWGWLLPRQSKIVYNMDGMEWHRAKYNSLIKKFLRYAEKLAVKYSDRVVADSEIIREYYENNYNKPVYFIPYGADIFDQPGLGTLDLFGLKPYSYNILIARLQPDNNPEMILDGVMQSKSDRKMLVIGQDTTTYGKYLKDKYRSDKIRYFGGIYDIKILNNLRYYSHLYFHGHSAGGTNPSLLEAMAASGLISAFASPYNESVLGGSAFYFSNRDQVTRLIDDDIIKHDYQGFIESNLKKIENKYNWPKIIDDYFECLFSD